MWFLARAPEPCPHPFNCRVEDDKNLHDRALHNRQGGGLDEQ